METHIRVTGWITCGMVTVLWSVEPYPRLLLVSTSGSGCTTRDMATAPWTMFSSKWIICLYFHYLPFPYIFPSFLPSLLHSLLPSVSSYFSFSLDSVIIFPSSFNFFLSYICPFLTPSLHPFIFYFHLSFLPSYLSIFLSFSFSYSFVCVFYSTRGEKYMGMWENDYRHGPGIVVTLEGIYTQGNFIQNKLMVKNIMLMNKPFSYHIQ